MATSSIMQLGHSIVKPSSIFRNHPPQLWNRRGSSSRTPPPPNALLRRLAHFLLLPLSHNLHLHPHSLQIHHLNLPSNPPLPPLLRRRSPPLSPPMSTLLTPTTTTTNLDSKTVRVVVKGRVQGVFYRNWTVENAIELGLNGWVRNRRDGSVEALFSGTPDKVQEMEQRCRRGPPAAMVTGFEVFPCTEDPGARFELRRTV